MKSFSANGNKTRVSIAWSEANQAWLVWREDGGIQGNMRFHTEKAPAISDFNERRAFMAEMGVLDND